MGGWGRNKFGHVVGGDGMHSAEANSAEVNVLKRVIKLCARNLVIQSNASITLEDIPAVMQVHRNGAFYSPRNLARQ